MTDLGNQTLIKITMNKEQINQDFNTRILRMKKINGLIETMSALVEEGILTGLEMEHILYKVRAKTDDNSFFATWHDNHLEKK